MTNVALRLPTCMYNKAHDTNCSELDLARKYSRIMPPVNSTLSHIHVAENHNNLVITES